MQATRIEIELPGWLRSTLASTPEFGSLEERMAFVIELSERNGHQGSGGPFAAAVFERGRNRLLAVGVNLVSSAGYSCAHAEVVALSLAQRTLGQFDLSAAELDCELLSSAEPCAMCLGACCWSGIRQLVCGARGEDAEAIGFDEGPKPAGWPAALRERGIAVLRDVLRPQAAAVLRRYQQADGLIYNPRKPRRKPRRDACG